MNTIQKAILISLISIAAISWVFSNYQPDMMKAMMTYDPIAVSLFTISWTVGMAAMMFPSITPMVLLYNRLEALLRPPEALTEASEVEGAKQAVHGQLSAESVFSRRNKFVDNWDDSNMKAMVEKPGVVVVRGRGHLDGPRRVIVSSKDDGITLVANKAVVLSTGTRARIDPKVKGLTEAQPWTNRNATGAKKVPSSLAIMGDGPVACEMAHAYSSLGTKVTLLSINDWILGRYEPFVGERKSSNVEAYQYVPI